MKLLSIFLSNLPSVITWLGSNESSLSCSPTHAYNVLTLRHCSSLPLVSEKLRGCALNHFIIFRALIGNTEIYIPRCLEEVVEDEEEEVVFPFPVSRPNLAAAAAMTAWEAAEVAAASFNTVDVSTFSVKCPPNSFWWSGLELEVNDSDEPADELLVVGKGLIDLGAAVGGAMLWWWCWFGLESSL